MAIQWNKFDWQLGLCSNAIFFRFLTLYCLSHILRISIYVRVVGTHFSNKKPKIEKSQTIIFKWKCHQLKSLNLLKAGFNIPVIIFGIVFVVNFHLLYHLCNNSFSEKFYSLTVAKYVFVYVYSIASIHLPSILQIVSFHSAFQSMFLPFILESQKREEKQQQQKIPLFVELPLKMNVVRSNSRQWQ